MGEDPDAPGRMAVRTPMQWDAGRNGGFSTAAPSRLASRPVTGAYGPEHVNVAQARRDPDSLYHHVRRLIHAYRRSPEIGWGQFELLDQPDGGTAVLAHRVTWYGTPEDEGSGDERRDPEEVPLSAVMLHNFSAEAQAVRVDLCGGRWTAERIGGWPLHDLLDGEDQAIGADGTVEVLLDGYGHRWFRVGHPGDTRMA